MNMLRLCHGMAGVLKGLGLGLCLLGGSAAAATEETFDVFQVGRHLYTNVTVTTRAKDYIFIHHANGIINIKVSELSPEIKERLGYPLDKSQASGTGTWTQQTFSRVEGTPQVQSVERQVKQAWLQQMQRGRSYAAMVTPQLLRTLLLSLLGVMLLIHLLLGYCSLLICRKTGHPPGVLVWIPLLQLIPLLRAAGMSAWWFAAYFVPVLNVVAQILWSLKIVRARDKSVWIAILLLLPLTNLFAFLYLAFSNGAPPKKEKEERVEIMTLETA